MKKLLLIILSITIFVSMVTAVFAGSIDADLVANDDALVFIGIINDFIVTDKEDDYPSTQYSLTVTPTNKLKGDVKIDEKLDFEKVWTGKLKLQNNSKYLFGYLPDELYIWELDSYENLFDWEKDDYTAESIILKERHNNSISEVMQDFLNEGVFERAEIERQDIGNQISFMEFLHEGPPLSSLEVKKVTLRYQDELHEVDVDEFENIAKEILITNVKNEALHDETAKPKQPEPYKTNLYIELLDENEQMVSYAAISRYGEVDRYGLFMSRMMSKDYEMKKEDLSKLYSLLPEDVRKVIIVSEESSVEPSEHSDIPEKNYIPWIVGGSVTIFVIAFIIGFIVNLNKVI